MADQLRVERERAERAEAGRKAANARADSLEDRAKKAEKHSRELRAAPGSSGRTSEDGGRRGGADSRRVAGDKAAASGCRSRGG